MEGVVMEPFPATPVQHRYTCQAFVHSDEIELVVNDYSRGTVPFSVDRDGRLNLILTVDDVVDIHVSANRPELEYLCDEVYDSVLEVVSTR